MNWNKCFVRLKPIIINCTSARILVFSHKCHHQFFFFISHFLLFFINNLKIIIFFLATAHDIWTFLNESIIIELKTMRMHSTFNSELSTKCSQVDLDVFRIFFLFYPIKQKKRKLINKTKNLVLSSLNFA